MRRCMWIGFAAIAASPAAAGDVWFVDAAAPPWGNGLSWATAFQNLQDALEHDGLSPGDEIRVAAGTYYPDRTAGGLDGNDDQRETFRLVGGVSLLGGFPPGGGTPAQRDPQAHSTVLSGSIYELDEPSAGCATVAPGAGDCLQSTPGVPSCFNFGCCAIICDVMPLCCLVSWNENCAEAAEAVCPFSRSLHVISAASDALVDGFTIRDGWAGGQPDYYNPYDDSGAGLLVYSSSSPVIANCTFEGNIANQGGAIAVIGQGCNPMFVNCRVAGNQGGIGGGIYVLQGDPTFVNCFILSNSAVAGGGGGVYASESNMKLVNCLLFDNLAVSHGAATYQVPALTNCIVWSSGTSPVDSATNVTACCIEGGYPGEGNVEIWPNFADPLHGNFRLGAGSTCIDAGVGPMPSDLGDLDGDLNVAEATPRDLGGGARVLGGGVDIGPYEHCAYDLDADGGVGVTDMLALMGSWGSTAGSAADFDQDGLVDISDLLALFQNWYGCD